MSFIFMFTRRFQRKFFSRFHRDFFPFFFIGMIIIVPIITLIFQKMEIPEDEIDNYVYDGDNISEWPPLKVYVYPKEKYHTDDCLYPPEMPNRYINETNYWFQRMLEPTIHKQLLQSPLYTDNPNEADMFLIPHYSRMCSGLDGGKRWDDIPNYLSKHGNYLNRYSSVDHFIIHSVPHYGDKPADKAISIDKAPIIGLLDFKTALLKKSPWKFARSMVLPFITQMRELSLNRKRSISAFVAMATSSQGLAGKSAQIRQRIESELNNVPHTKVITIVRNNYNSFRAAMGSLSDYMTKSKYCVVPPGDAPSSKRFFDSVQHLCIPLLISDYYVLPFEDVPIDYAGSIIHFPSRQIENNLSTLLKSITPEEYNKQKNALKTTKERFTWDYKLPPKVGQGLWTFSWALYDRHSMMKPYLNNELTNDEGDPDYIFPISSVSDV